MSQILEACPKQSKHKSVILATDPLRRHCMPSTFQLLHVVWHHSSRGKKVSLWRSSIQNIPDYLEFYRSRYTCVYVFTKYEWRRLKLRLCHLTTWDTNKKLSSGRKSTWYLNPMAYVQLTHRTQMIEKTIFCKSSSDLNCCGIFVYREDVSLWHV